MRDSVVVNWLSEVIFGSSNARRSAKQLHTTVGIAKGVPLDMGDSELQNDVDRTLHGTTFYRMTKGPTKQRLRTVKIYFKSEVDIENAIKNGLKLQSENQYVRVEALKWKPHVRHCTNCWRLGHSQSQCNSEKACKHCGEGTDVGSHIICVDQPKCRNCGGQHSTDHHSQCDEYQKRLKRINQRHLELQDGG